MDMNASDDMGMTVSVQPGRSIDTDNKRCPGRDERNGACHAAERQGMFDFSERIFLSF